MSLPTYSEDPMERPPPAPARPGVATAPASRSLPPGRWKWRSIEVGEELMRFRTKRTVEALYAYLEKVRRTGY